MEETYKACPRCGELTETGDHYPCADDSAWHVLCYQAAVVEAGQPDPFPVCDYCAQIIWQTAEDGGLNLVVRGLVACKNEAGENDWRPARWHPECAPGEEIAADRIDTPPPLPPAHDPESSPPATPVEVPRAPIGSPCAKCGKAVQRGLIMFEGQPYHTLCAKRAGAVLRTRPKCVMCNKAIRPEAEIECESGDEIVFYDRKCYRAACLDAGMPDPFPSSTRGRKANGDARSTRETRLCRICQNNVPREDFRDHVNAHEEGQWAKK